MPLGPRHSTANARPGRARRRTGGWDAFPFALLVGASALGATAPGSQSANRLTYLDSADPFYVGTAFPRLTTPQWIGEPGVDVAVVYGIDDLRDPTRYETYLRPLLDRLKAIDGRAPVSIFVNAVAPDHPRLQPWLKEGLSFEVHTLSHPCPILAKGILGPAQETYHGGVELLNLIPGNPPVAFRTPCCDSINSASPRLFTEFLGRTNGAGQFLSVDSSVAMILTTNDPALPAARLVDPDGRPTFRKYVPFPAFTTTLENYPYPYLVQNRIWELPFVVPSDWEAQNLHGNASPRLLADWKTALDLVALKQGTFTFVFHPYEWSSPTQHVAFVEHAVATLGRRVKFLTCREVHDRLTHHLLADQPARADSGDDNGVRLVDLNNDGFLDVILANDAVRRTRIWDPTRQAWQEGAFPVALSGAAPVARFGILSDHAVVLLARDESTAGAWHFDGRAWVEDSRLLLGLVIDGEPVRVREGGRDRGVRLRDVDGDGVAELLVANERQHAIFAWSATERTWRRSDVRFPAEAAFVNARGEDSGLRFADLDGDGRDDLLVSNEFLYASWGWNPGTTTEPGRGWTREGLRGKRSDAGAMPAFVREGRYRDNGAWFHSQTLWVQNEDTAALPNLVDRRSFTELLPRAAAAVTSPTSFPSSRP